MDTIIKSTDLDQADILQIYNEGNENIKQHLIKKFGKDFFGKDFFEKDWKRLFEVFCETKNLKITYDPALKREAGYAYLPHENPFDAEEEHENASKMLRIIISDKNRELGFKADYKNRMQERWFPVFEMTEAGLVFSHASYGAWRSGMIAIVGAPFVTASSENAKQLALQYLPIYRKYLLTQ